ncbi:MAG: N-acetylmuramoyl-L-alanine amidase family protein, partial [Akkermansiaceae bacterium]
LIAISVLLSAQSSNAQNFKWDTTKLNGREYVSLRSLQKFYNFAPMKHGAVVTMENKVYKLEFRIGTQRFRMNSVLFNLSFPVLKHGKKYLLSRIDLVNLIDPVLRPGYIHNASVPRVVVLDPGHGGKDSGAVGPFGKHEKDYALIVSKLARDMLRRKGFKVVMTRETDVFISLRNRVNIANKYPGAIFFSVHFNSSNNRANGIETFTISPVGVAHMGRGIRPRDFNAVPGNVMGSASIALATAVHSRSLMYINDPKRAGNRFNITDRGIKRARFNVLTGIRIPAVLLEGGFLSNRQEASKIHSNAYQITLASAITRAAEVYRNEMIIRNKKRNVGR